MIRVNRFLTRRCGASLKKFYARGKKKWVRVCFVFVCCWTNSATLTRFNSRASFIALYFLKKQCIKIILFSHISIERYLKYLSNARSMNDGFFLVLEIWRVKVTKFIPFIPFIFRGFLANFSLRNYLFLIKNAFPTDLNTQRWK